MIGCNNKEISDLEHAGEAHDEVDVIRHVREGHNEVLAFRLRRNFVHHHYNKLIMLILVNRRVANL